MMDEMEPRVRCLLFPVSYSRPLPQLCPTCACPRPGIV
jgi:hypothetical protein